MAQIVVNMDPKTNQKLPWIRSFVNATGSQWNTSRLYNCGNVTKPGKWHYSEVLTDLDLIISLIDRFSALSTTLWIPRLMMEIFQYFLGAAPSAPILSLERFARKAGTLCVDEIWETALKKESHSESVGNIALKPLCVPCKSTHFAFKAMWPAQVLHMLSANRLFLQQSYLLYLRPGLHHQALFFQIQSWLY